ncbi:MAG TPA: hypothetical protein VEC08_05920 [Nitrososphaerales archaeon]|nr:hypothetical protein [Nitrososphaerales archaeon]
MLLPQYLLPLKRVGFLTDTIVNVTAASTVKVPVSFSITVRVSPR